MKILLCGIVVLLTLLQIRLWTGEGSLADVVRLKANIQQQQSENERLKERNRLLAAEVSALKNGTEGIEERARTQMGMIKEGETFFMIVDQHPKDKK